MTSITYLTINRQDVTTLFDQLIELDSPYRTMHLLGEAKMGKTHLMTRIFPHRAGEHRLHCVMLDLRGQIRVADILQNLRSRLTEAGPFANFDRAYRDWVTRPIIEASDIQGMFAKINISAQKTEDESQKIDPMLTTQFVTDLRLMTACPIVLLFDALDMASQPIQDWLFYILLGQLALLPHLRVVVAGRNLPEPGGDYAACCQVHRLKPVRDEMEYIIYCQKIKATLVEQSIRDFARAIDYRPGQFVGLIEAFKEV